MTLALQAINLSKRFKKLKAVDNLNLEVPVGAVYGFLGPNGSGKSTTIRMMTDLIRPDSGEIIIDGLSVQKLHNKALINVGSFTERADFYKHLSAESNLKMLARMDGIQFSRIDEVLNRVKLAHRSTDKIKNYSQGMRQRLGIAQALLSNPKLLILDEPTNGLDPQGMKEVRELIGELSSEGITIFLSTHLLDEVQKICSHVGIIHHGKLVSAGSIHDLLKTSDLFVTEIRLSSIDNAVEILKKQPWIHRLEIKDDSIMVNVHSEKLSDLTELLVHNGCKVEAIIPRTSLEDLFLSKIHD